MINRYMKHVAEPIVKKERKNKKEPLLKKITDYALLGLAAGLVFNTVAQVGYDYATNSEIVDVDFGPASIVFSHKDTRSTEELFRDIQNRISQIEGMEEAIKNNGSLTLEEQKRILKEVISVIADEAKLSTNNYELKEMNGRLGFYFTMKNPLFSISMDDVFLNENALGLTDFKQTLKLTIHEMFHAVEDQNRMKGKTVSKFDKKVFYSSKAPKDYVSSPNEFNAFFWSVKIINDLEKQYGGISYNSQTPEQLLREVFSDIMYNLYGVDTFKNHDLAFMPYEYSQLVFQDENDYRLLTMDELIIKGYEKKLEARNIKYEGVDLTESYYYESLSLAISLIDENILDVRYVDFLNKTYDFKINNVEEDIAAFELAIENQTNEHNKNIFIATKLSKYSNVFRYHMDEYTKEEKDLLAEQVLKYIGQVSSENMKIFGLNDVEEKLTERALFMQNLSNQTKDSNFER